MRIGYTNTEYKVEWEANASILLLLLLESLLQAIGKLTFIVPLVDFSAVKTKAVSIYEQREPRDLVILTVIKFDLTKLEIT
jgi:hypothetical protein